MNAHQMENTAGHRRFTEQLGAYLDGELAQDDLSILEAHLRGCERCRRELSLQHAIRERLEHQSMERAPAALRERIQMRLEAADAAHLPSRKGKRWRPRALRTPLAWTGWAVAASLALALALGLTLGLPRGPHSVPMIAAAMADYHSHLASELPVANAASLATLKSSLPFPVTPIPSLRKNLIAAWTADIRGEPAAALAYKLDNRVVVQYVVSESLFFRQPNLREAIATHGRYVASLGQDTVMAWPSTDSGSILIGPLSAKQLESVDL